MSAITPAQAEYLNSLIQSASKNPDIVEEYTRKNIHANAVALSMKASKAWACIKGEVAAARGEDVEAAKKAALAEAKELKDPFADENFFMDLFKPAAAAVMADYIQEFNAKLAVDVDSLTKEDASALIDTFKNHRPTEVDLEERIIKHIIAEMAAEPVEAAAPAQEPKSTHILPTSDFPDDIIKEAGTTDFTKNWIMIAGDTAIIAQSNVDAVQYAAQLTGNAYEEFNGRIRRGIQRLTRERIAGYFGIDEADVKIARRETNGFSSVWMRFYELDNPEKHYGPF